MSVDTQCMPQAVGHLYIHGTTACYFATQSSARASKSCRTYPAFGHAGHTRSSTAPLFPSTGLAAKANMPTAEPISWNVRVPIAGWLGWVQLTTTCLTLYTIVSYGVFTLETWQPVWSLMQWGFGIAIYTTILRVLLWTHWLMVLNDPAPLFPWAFVRWSSLQRL